MNKCSDFHFVVVLVVKKIFLFPVVPLLKVLPFDNLKFVCLSCLYICLGLKSCKNWSIVSKIGYVFHGSNLSLYSKINHSISIYCFTEHFRNLNAFIVIFNDSNWQESAVWFKLHRSDLHTKISHRIQQYIFFTEHFKILNTLTFTVSF